MDFHGILAVGIGGALGALSRWTLSNFIVWLAPAPRIPLAVGAVNLIACFLFGAFSMLFLGRTGIPTAAKLFLLTGFLGAFSTFSTYIYEVVALIEQKDLLGALLLFLLGNGLGLLGMLAGMSLASLILNGGS